MSPLEKELARDALVNIVFNLILLISGIVLLSAAFSWEAGVGIGLLFMFLKGGK